MEVSRIKSHQQTISKTIDSPSQTMPQIQTIKLEQVASLLKGSMVHVFLSALEDQLFAVGNLQSLVVRFSLRKQQMVCVSKSELTGADWIAEDAWGKIWVFSFGTDKRIFKLNRELFLEEFYEIPSVAALNVQPWAIPCVINREKTSVYFPTGLNSNSILQIHAESAEGGKKSASIVPMSQVAHRKAISNLVITCDDRYLIVDQGTRSVKVIDLRKEFTDFDHHIDNSKEKLTLVKPSATSPDILFFSGNERLIPCISAFRIVPGQKLELIQTVKLTFEQVVRSIILLSTPETDPKSTNNSETVLALNSEGKVASISADPTSQVPLVTQSYSSIQQGQKHELSVKSSFNYNNIVLTVSQKEGSSQACSIYYSLVN